MEIDKMHQHLFLLKLCLLFNIHTGICAQSVTLSVNNLFVKNGEIADLKCELFGNCSLIIWKISSVSGTIASSFHNGGCYNSTDGYYQVCDHSNKSYTFYFVVHRSLDQQTITCQAEDCDTEMENGDSVKDTAKILIIVPFTSAVATPNRSVQVFENTAIQTVCITTPPSRPSAIITWYIKSKRDGPSTQIQIDNPQGLNVSNTVSSKSTLRYKANSDDNNKFVYCKASAYGIDTVESDDVQLDVTYTPKGSLIITGNYTNKGVIEGETIQLTCSINRGNPSAIISWSCNGRSMHGLVNYNSTTTHSILQITVSREYNYQHCVCSVKQAITGYRKDTIKSFQVLYGPRNVTWTPTVPGIYHVPEGSLVPDITCESICNPICTYVWKSSKFIFYGPILSLNNISRKESGIYVCEAKNEIGNISSNEIIYDVLYAPGITGLHPQKRIYNVNEIDKDALIECNATCNPPCNIYWFSEQERNVVQNGSILLLQNITCSSVLRYQCLAQNSLGSTMSQAVKLLCHKKNMTITLVYIMIPCLVFLTCSSIVVFLFSISKKRKVKPGETRDGNIARDEDMDRNETSHYDYIGDFEVPTDSNNRNSATENKEEEMYDDFDRIESLPTDSNNRYSATENNDREIYDDFDRIEPLPTDSNNQNSATENNDREIYDDFDRIEPYNVKINTDYQVLEIQETIKQYTTLHKKKVFCPCCCLKKKKKLINIQETTTDVTEDTADYLEVIG